MENNTTIDVLDDEGFFSSLYQEWSVTKILAVVTFGVTQTIGNGLLIGIVWYERSGSDFHYRTLINQLTSSFCMMLIVMNLTLTNVVAFSHLTGPLSQGTCLAVIFGTNFFLTLGLLYMDTIIILRYLYIFRWKTVGAINDDIFAIFSTINNITIAFLLCVVLTILGFNHNINYIFCTNGNPMANGFNEGHMYSYDIFCILPFFSYVIHIFVFLRIYFYRKKKNGGGGTLLQPEQTKNIADLTTGMLVMGLIFFSSVPTALIMVYFEPDELLSQPGLACLYLAHFGIQFTTSVPIPVTYYCRNDNLRKGVTRKIKENLSCFGCMCNNKESNFFFSSYTRFRIWYLKQKLTKVPQTESIQLETIS